MPLTPADASATYSDITYEITAYLDTSVGNAYQNGGLSVNFRWWVEETDHLGTPALGEKPGESSSDGGSGGCRFCWLWILLAILILLAVLILVFVLIKRRKEKSNRENSENSRA